ncbi:SDR family oxidoreductase [Halobacillus karajensis]|uniref:Cyclopentanol dehydrogenase n=1 Tax=Halobacillus karajensis TaxID=195088 RepID=A0A024P4E9_9BACI|nr:SDR family oxidoreductase [Halobacillus karajensis]CDQ20007.1 Cyclopentanol dehydrogenase [Halobacillus karajensis]CDQ22467.1 Cyclopentanol dehydrogenase [Halobacillus karajensis]CDQ28310.1 Cyclopentanol dehydrogenase [Halobacillus karajensis]
MKQTVLITGSSSGFGYHTAVKCAEKGFHVIATMRNMDKAFAFDRLEEVVKERIEVWQLDVTDEQSLERFSEQVNELNRLDVLVNNAGYAVGGFLEQVPLDTYRRQFETNVFGVIAVTKAVLPIMRKQARGKILNVSSVSGLIGFPGLSAYVSSKHALEGLSESLRLEVKPFGIDVALIEPGSYQTNIWSSGLELPESVYNPATPYSDYIKGLWNALNREDHGNPQDVSTLMTELMEKEELAKLRYPIGPGVRTNVWIKRLLPWKWLETTVLQKLLGKEKTKGAGLNGKGAEWSRRNPVRG